MQSIPVRIADSIIKLQYDGGLQILEIIVVTYEIAQVNDCIIRYNGSLKGGILTDFSRFF